MSIPTIAAAEVQRLIQAGRSPLILDVRTPAEFARVHVRGARSMPLDSVDLGAVTNLPRNGDDPLYVICQSGARAAKACERFIQAGIGPVYSIEGGTAAWAGAGLPVERGKGKVISLERQVRIVAGSIVFLGTIFAWAVHPLFLAIPALVGAGLVFAGVTDFCGMALLLAKMPWNRT